MSGHSVWPSPYGAVRTQLGQLRPHVEIMLPPYAFYTPELDRWLADINADRQNWAAVMVDELIALRREGLAFEDAWKAAWKRVGRPPASNVGGWGTLNPSKPIAETPLQFFYRVAQAGYERRDLERPAIQDAERLAA